MLNRNKGNQGNQGNKGNKGKDGIEGWRNAGPSFLVGRNFKISALTGKVWINTPPKLVQGLAIISTRADKANDCTGKAILY